MKENKVSLPPQLSSAKWLWLLSGAVATLAWYPSIVEGVRRIPKGISFPGQRLAHDIKKVANEEPTEVDEEHEEKLRRLSQLTEERYLNNGGDQNTGPSSPDEHLITSLPLLPDGAFPTKQWAGHIPASPDDDKKIFYWLFEPDFSVVGDDGNPDVPLLIWLNGGPGCSSMIGLFMENGPFHLDKVNENWELQVNPSSWHRAPAYTLYIDQPVGTGLSFTKKEKYCKNDLEINVDFYYFLTQLLLLHKDRFLVPLDGQENANNSGPDAMRYKVKLPFYFSGESHAGHYIPSMMDYILQRNDDTEENPPQVIIPLAGAAIGNGWIDPFHQYAGATAAYGVGLIDFAQKSSLDELEIVCQKNLNNGTLVSDVCFDILDNILDQGFGNSSKYEISQYDNRLYEEKHKSRTYPQGHKDVEQYLGGSLSNGLKYKTVLEAIHASESISAGQHFRECANPPFFALSHQDGLGVVSEVVRILDHPTKPRLLFFNGVNDLICNHAGNEKLLDMLPWRNTEPWALSARFGWRSRPSEANSGPPIDGYMKQFENLLFLKVLESGHMVPMDQPEVSLDMMTTFIYHGSFQHSEQILKRRKPVDDSMLGIAECLPCPNCELEGTTVAPASGSPIDDKGNETEAELITAKEEVNQKQQQGGEYAKNTDKEGEKSATSSSDGFYIEPEDDGRVHAPARHFLTAGGLVGAIVGALALFYAFIMKQRIRKGLVIVRGDDFDMEMTGDTSGASTTTSNDGSAMSVEYHDDPSSSSSSSDNGGSLII